MTSQTFEQLPIDKVKLDITNPRIKRFLESYEGDEPTPDQIYLALGAGSDEGDSAGPSFEKLKNSILTNGGIIHPIIVNKKGKNDLVCIEGNTRLALYRSFSIEGAPGNWKKIPALVYSDMSEQQIDATSASVRRKPSCISRFREFYLLH